LAVIPSCLLRFVRPTIREPHETERFTPTAVPTLPCATHAATPTREREQHGQQPLPLRRVRAYVDRGEGTKILAPRRLVRRSPHLRLFLPQPLNRRALIGVGANRRPRRVPPSLLLLRLLRRLLPSARRAVLRPSCQRRCGIGLVTCSGSDGRRSSSEEEFAARAVATSVSGGSSPAGRAAIRVSVSTCAAAASRQLCGGP
jgi:hypothetical protein